MQPRTTDTPRLDLAGVLARCTPAALAVLVDAGEHARGEAVTPDDLDAALGRWSTRAFAAARGLPPGASPTPAPARTPDPRPACLAPATRALLAGAFYLASSEGPDRPVAVGHLLVAMKAAGAASADPCVPPAKPVSPPWSLSPLDSFPLADAVLSLVTAARQSRDPVRGRLLLARAERLRAKLRAG